MVAHSPKWCSVHLSEVRKRGLRLEASVHDVDAINARAKIEKLPLPAVPLWGSQNSPVSTAFYGTRGKRNYVPRTCSTSIGFLGSSEMLACDPSPVKFMASGEEADSFQIEEGMILISRSGTIGNVTFANKTLSCFLVSEHAIRLKCISHPGYVYTFLKSRTGQVLIQSCVFGSVIQEIEPEHLASIPIPDAPLEVKTRIHESIVKSYALRDESNELLHKATRLLQDALGFPSLQDFPECSSSDAKFPQTFAVRLRSLSGRLDGSYHIPVVHAIEARLAASGAGMATVGDSRISKSVILPGRFKRVYVEEGCGKVFIGGKQLGELDPSNKKFLSIAHHGERIEQQLTLQENMTLITCSGTIGRVALVGRHWEGWTASQHVMRIIPASTDIAGFLYVWLSSEWAKPLILRYSYGAVIDEIDDVQLRSVPVPILSDSNLQSEINTLALTASSLRTQAYDLECAALQDMEKNVLGEPLH